MWRHNGENVTLLVPDAIDDMKKNEMSPYGRVAFWWKNGFRPTAFQYVQLKLRKELKEFDGLNYLVKGWDGSIPSEIIWDMVSKHAKLCLAKQRDYDLNDQEVLKKMKDQLEGREIPVDLNVSKKENLFFAAIVHYLSGSSGLENPTVQEAANHYLSELKKIAATFHSIAPEARSPGLQEGPKILGL